MLSRLQSVSVALSCLQVSGATWSDVWDARVGSGIAQFLTPTDLARVSLVENRTRHSPLLVHKFEPQGVFSWTELPAVLPYCKFLNLSHANNRVTPPGSLTSLRFPNLVSLNLGPRVGGDDLSQETMGVFSSVQKLSIASRFRGFLAPPEPGVPGVYPIAQVFPNLKSLTIRYSGSVTDWGFLAAYPNLEVLNIPEGTISDAQWHLLPLTLRKLEINQVSQPLPPLPFLESLFVADRFRGFLAPPEPGVPGVYPIAQVFPNLKSLTIGHSGSVTDWGFLAASPDLEVLNIPDGTISDEQWHLLSRNLRKLAINQVSQPLPALRFLEHLRVNKWLLTDLNSLRVSHSPSVLRTLQIYQARLLTNIASLGDLPILRDLDLRGLSNWNAVLAPQMAEAISGFTQLESFSIEHSGF